MLKLKRRKGTPFWIARGTINGIRIERSTGETSETKARKALPDLVATVLAERAATEKPPGTWREMNFVSAANAYTKAGRDGRFLDKLLPPLKDYVCGQIDNAIMATVAADLYPDRAPATIRRQVYAPVTAVINFVKDDKLRAPKGGGTRTVFLTPEQAEALIQQLTTQPNPSHAALATFWLGQGPRAGETFSLDGMDVNLAARYAILRDTKNGEERTITLIPRVVAALSLLPTIGKPGPVFRRVDGNAYKPRKGRGGQVRNPFAFAVEKIGLDPHVYTPHVCRHTWATWFYAVTKDPLKLKSEGGWKSNEYQRYVKSAPAGLSESIRRHGWDFSGENWGNAVSRAAASDEN